jgi:hypothetical protein
MKPLIYLQAYPEDLQRKVAQLIRADGLPVLLRQSTRSHMESGPTVRCTST